MGKADEPVDQRAVLGNPLLLLTAGVFRRRGLVGLGRPQPFFHGPNVTRVVVDEKAIHEEPSAQDLEKAHVR